jgi:peptidoglycan/xylan/chitin deacetylase (PgdA/CDA1 family)
MAASRSERVAALLDTRGLRELLARVPAWHGALVLNYHRIGNAGAQPWDRTLFSATAERLDAQLAVLAREADVVGPADLPSLVAAGRGRHVLLTFDDGYRDNHELAFPLLRRHGLTATFFLATGFIDAPHAAWWDEIAWMARRATSAQVPAGEWLSTPVPLAPAAEGAAADATRDAAAAALVRVYKALPAARADAYLDFLAEATGTGRCDADAVAEMWMTWEMARELRDGGMTIGGHTVTHPLLARVPVERQEEEVAGCKRRLGDELDDPMRWFSYPVGSPDAFTATTQEILRRNDVELAFSFHGGWVGGTVLDAFDVPRVHVGPQMDPARLRATLRLPQLFARPD